jgi:hypothetical protein
MWYEQPSELDTDAAGVPCADQFPAEAEAAFGGPNASEVEIIADWSTATFAATGPAVDAGLICAMGAFEESGGDEEGYGVTYTCDDGSGSFIWRGDIFFHDNSHETNVWRIESGTGDYTSLMGGGGAISMWYDAITTSIGRLRITEDEN